MRMCSQKDYIKRRLLIICLVLVLFMGCSQKSGETPNESQDLSTLTPEIAPTETEKPLPLALRVNGEAVLLSDYEKELDLLKKALTETETVWTADQQKEAVLNEIISTVLLAQEAAEKGHMITEDDVQARLDQVTMEAGGSAALSDWMNAFGYDETYLKYSLQRSMLAAWARDEIISHIGETAEQVHVRQIRTTDQNKANSYLAQLQSGIEFATLAEAVDPLTGGDLGWFPQGYLLQPELNEAAFDIKPGEYSGVIQTKIGFHILEVLEKDPARPLTSETRSFLQHKLIEDWLQKKIEQAAIEVLVP